MPGSRRARADQRAQRTNAAVALLAHGDDVAAAARQLAAQHGLSERQARRYVEQARHGGQVEVPRPGWCSPSSSRPSWPAGSAAPPTPAARRSARWSPRRSPSSSTACTRGLAGDHRASGRVRAGLRPPRPGAAGAGLPAPGSRASGPGGSIPPTREERCRPPRSTPASPRPARRNSRRSKARPPRCWPTPPSWALTSRLGGCSRTRAAPVRPWSARRWSGCGTWSARCRSRWCRAMRLTGWPASTPTRRCWWRSSPARAPRSASSTARPATVPRMRCWCSSRARSPSTRRRRPPSGPAAARPTAPSKAR